LTKKFVEELLMMGMPLCGVDKNLFELQEV
jgi:hypothetical protein